MAIDKRNNGEQAVSPRSVRARCFHFYDHSKNTQIQSILKRGRRMRYSNANLFNEMPTTAYETSRIEQCYQSSDPLTSCNYSSEKILKIIMPNEILDIDPEIPSSFSPPSNKLPKKKSSTDYRELSNSDGYAKRNVRFHSKVLVMRIPSRYQYPESIKRTLWCSLSEIARSAQRNTIEFTSEGWNWRTAVEEKSMYIHPRTGQYIHPVHVQRANSPTSPKSPDVDNEGPSRGMEAKTGSVEKDDEGACADQAEPAQA